MMLSSQDACIFPPGEIATSPLSITPPPILLVSRKNTHSPALENQRKRSSSLSLSFKAFNDHIPAVKIAGAVISPLVLLDNIESVCDDLLQVVPDSCISSSLMDRTMNKTTAPSSADPIIPVSVPSSTTTTTTDASIPSVSTDESDEDSDLDEFLLDAALWL